MPGGLKVDIKFSKRFYPDEIFDGGASKHYVDHVIQDWRREPCTCESAYTAVDAMLVPSTLS